MSEGAKICYKPKLPIQCGWGFHVYGWMETFVSVASGDKEMEVNVKIGVVGEGSL